MSLLIGVGKVNPVAVSLFLKNNRMPGRSAFDWFCWIVMTNSADTLLNSRKTHNLPDKCPSLPANFRTLYGQGNQAKSEGKIRSQVH
ncbi:MAG: hypothetical protein OEY56_06020 [Cyclobacteriaceae bacterium]|nr:hypothetical protein [Cyclobacteriaceae bacterium]